MPKLKHINVVFLYTADMDGMRHFYEKTVGFGPPSCETEDWVEYSLGSGTRFALHRTTAEFRGAACGGRGPVQFSIVVEHLDQAWQELEAKGVAFLRTPEHGPGFRLAEFEDPEGNPIRLIEFE